MRSIDVVGRWIKRENEFAVFGLLECPQIALLTRIDNSSTRFVSCGTICTKTNKRSHLDVIAIQCSSRDNEFLEHGVRRERGKQNNWFSYLKFRRNQGDNIEFRTRAAKVLLLFAQSFEGENDSSTGVECHDELHFNDTFVEANRLKVLPLARSLFKAESLSCPTIIYLKHFCGRILI